MKAELMEKYPDIADSAYHKTGLVFDPYFSGTKLRWILNNVEGIREKAEAGELAFGTVDSWLIFKLTKGKVHATDYSNASRTLLFNINTCEWDDELCERLEVPKSMLPEAKASSADFGESDPEFFGGPIPIRGVAGDQQAALFGQTCYTPGEAKNTYGTGCFMLMNIGEKPLYPNNGLLTTIAWGLDGKVEYALEGSVFVAGAAIQWLRDELKIVDQSPDSEYFATRVKDTNGCYVVPAFTGLGAPYWDPEARGSMFGITRGTTREHIVRATLQSLVYQNEDLLAAMKADTGKEITSLKVDGGAAMNNLLMQFQADISDVDIVRYASIESTSLGAAYLAGLAVGYYNSLADIVASKEIAMTFKPSLGEKERKEKLNGWHRAVKATIAFREE
jgi:glycerol kinase